MKKIKRFVAACAATVMLFSLTAKANAEEFEENGAYVCETDDNEDYVLISEQTIVIDDETTCVSRIYQKADEVNTYSAKSSSGHMTVTAENTFSYTYGGVTSVWATLWVKGTFYWDSEKDTATVSNVTAGKELGPGKYYKVLEEPEVLHENNQGATFLFGKKYAYIEKKLKMSNGASGSEKTLTLWLDVNVVGDITTKPGSANVTVN